MSRRVFAPLAAVLSVAVLAGSVLAQDRTPAAPSRSDGRTAPVATAPVQDPAAASRDAQLRALGESYRRSGDEEQDPGELNRTRDLNAGIVARNNAADRTDAEALAAYEAEQRRHREAVAAYEQAVADREAEIARAQAVAAREQADYQRRRAAYEAEVRVCEATGARNCRSGDLPR